MKIQRLITISAICLSMSLAGRAQVIDDFLRPGPRPEPELCDDYFETFDWDMAGEILDHFEAGEDREFYRKLSLARDITPGAVIAGDRGQCYGFIFEVATTKPTRGIWTQKHKEMLFHLFSLGFDPNERIKNTPTTSGGADHTPVIARFGGSDLTLFKWFLEGGGNLYQTFSDWGGLRWHTPLSMILRGEAKNFPRTLPTVSYVLSEMDYPITEGRGCFLGRVAGRSDTWSWDALERRDHNAFTRQIRDLGFSYSKCESVPDVYRFLGAGGQLDWDYRE